MKQKNEIDTLLEWAVWGHLDSKNDLELILLKGHLLLEIIIDRTLEKNDFRDWENQSFYRKINLLDAIKTANNSNKDFIISSLKGINTLRNKLAHEFHTDITNGDIERWALNILNNLQGEKFTKYTFRTKVVHAFSVLAKNILEIDNYDLK